MASFHYYGRDKRGVRIWKGTWNNLPKWFTRGFLYYGAFAAVAGISLLLSRLFITLPKGYDTLTMVACIHACVFGGVGYFMDAQRRRINTLTPVEEVCAKLGVTQEELAEIATERNIKPVYNINEKDYYNLADLSDAASLLRASSAPSPTEELLRPAGSVESAPETLLRPTADTPPVTTASNEAKADETVPLRRA